MAGRDSLGPKFAPRCPFVDGGGLAHAAKERPRRRGHAPPGLSSQPNGPPGDEEPFDQNTSCIWVVLRTHLLSLGCAMICLAHKDGGDL